MHREHVISADGTRLVLDRAGAGPPLLLVHGAASDHHAWDPILPHLQPHFELLVLHRRGHGDSEPGPEPYGIHLEGEDVAAVLEHVGPDAFVFGHSWGARCTLLALAAGARAAGAVLYEPLETVHYDLDEVAAFEALEVPGADVTAVVTEFFVRFAQVPAEVVPRLRESLEWRQAVDAYGTLARETRAHLEQPLDLEGATRVAVPVRVLAGAQTHPDYLRTAERVVAAVPDAELVLIEGAGHAGHQRAAQQVAAAVLEFSRR